MAFFKMNDHLILTLFPKPSLAKVNIGPPSPSEFSIGHNVNSRGDVDPVMKQAQAAGAKIADPAHDRFWGGYSGYFQDLEGHLWEIAWHPDWIVKE